jgi:hypothetical protein
MADAVDANGGSDAGSASSAAVRAADAAASGLGGRATGSGNDGWRAILPRDKLWMMSAVAVSSAVGPWPSDAKIEAGATSPVIDIVSHTLARGAAGSAGGVCSSGAAHQPGGADLRVSLRLTYEQCCRLLRPVLWRLCDRPHRAKRPLASRPPAATWRRASTAARGTRGRTPGRKSRKRERVHERLTWSAAARASCGRG